MLAMPEPRLAVVSSERIGDRVHYGIHVGSPRAAPIIALTFAPEAQVSGLQLMAEAAPVSASPRRLRNGWSRLRLFGAPTAGLDLSFDASASSFTLQLMDESYGLPREGQFLQLARLHTAGPSQDGDVTLVTSMYRLQP
jgi:hypothetical protein